MATNAIDALIARMPLEEKVAQLYGIRVEDLEENGRLSLEKCRQLIPHGVGHLCQFASCTTLPTAEILAFVDELQAYVRSETQSKIPVALHEEVITGVAARGATITPQMIGMSCSWNPELVYENARMTAENMKKLGCYYALSPMMDLIHDARWGRGEEGYGEDPHLIAAFVLAFIRGLQESGTAATAKHYAGYGMENQDLAYFRNEVLVPFEAAVKAGKVKGVMPGYHAFHDVPCSASSFLLTDILRREWGFDGMVVSDYGAVINVHKVFGYAPTPEKAGAVSLQAGIDVELPFGETFPQLVDAVRRGEIPEERIDRSLRRVLAFKESLGILGGEGAGPAAGPIDLDPPANREQALLSARQAMVLLKNDGILPLADKPCRVAVVGPNADSYYAVQGDYTWMGVAEFFHRLKGSKDNPHLVTLLEGLRNRSGHFHIAYERGCGWTTSADQVTGTPIGDERGLHSEYTPLEDIPATDWNRAMTLARESDIVIAAMGENRYLCGEGCDRSDVRLPGDQEAFVRQLCDTGKPVILVVFGGRPMAIADIAARCAAVLYAWYPGEEGGNAAADILLGRANPCGKLTVSLPNASEDVPVFYQQGARAQACQYPFGFGLSYTTFAYANLRTVPRLSTADAWFDVSVDIRNTGDRAGAEVVQFYMTAADIPHKLLGFSRVELEPGEGKTVTVRVFLDTLARYDAQGTLHLDPQRFTLQAGSSSRDIHLSAPVAIEGASRILPQRTHFVSEDRT